MAGENIDVVTLLGYVDTKIKALQDFRVALLAAHAVGAFGQTGEAGDIPASLATNGDAGVPTELPKGAFLGKSLPVCVRLHLSAVRRKQSLKEIAAALRAGGVESTSDNFENVVNGAIQRLRAAGEILRFKEGYGLSEWYPSHLRGTPAPTKRLGKAKAKSARKRKRESDDKTAKETASGSVLPKEKAMEKGSNEKQIIDYFRKHPGREVSKGDIVDALTMRSQTATFLLGKLAHRQVLTKSESGTYRMANT